MLWLSKNPWQESKFKQNQLSNPLYVYGTTMQPNVPPIYEKQFEYQRENIPPEAITENGGKQLLLHKFKTYKAKPVKHKKAAKNQGNPIISIIISLIYIRE